MRSACLLAFLIAASVPAVAQEPPQACGPEAFTAQRIGMVINLTWEEVPGAGSYTIYRAQEDGGFQAAISVPAPATSTIDTQVESRFNYTYYAVAVIGGVETPPCGEVKVGPGGPCAPEVRATTSGDRILVQWGALPVSDSYNIYRAEGGGDLHFLASTDASTQRYLDADVEAGTAYTYDVRAVVGGDERPSCGTATITAIPTFPGMAAAAAIAVSALVYMAARRRS